MKMKVLLSSIGTIALCLCLIAGSTFALFTDTTDFNIAVTAGDVEIEANAKINALYSAKGADTADDEFLIDEKDHTYTHEKQTNGFFLNGGTASVTDGNLEIVRLTPGDRVDVDIVITNKSDVAFAYRYKLISDNSNLATGMVVTVDDVSYESLALWTSEWYPVITAPNGEPSEVPVKTISVELPVYAGNEYQSEKTAQEDGRPAGDQSVTYTIIVEAVQGNAVTDDESEVVIYRTETPVVTPAVDNDTFVPGALTSTYKDMYLLGDANIVVGTENWNNISLENVTADVNGSVIVIDDVDGSNPAIVIQNCDFILEDGEYIIDASRFGTAYQVFLMNVTVNGELLPVGVCDPAVGEYLNSVGWFQVVDPAFS